MSEPLVCIGSCNITWRKAQIAYEEAKNAYPALLAQIAAAVAAGEIDAKEAARIRPEPPERPTIRPILGDPVWCSRCTARIRISLAELDDLAAIYAAEADGRRSKGGSDKVSGSAHAPSPSPIAEDLDELYGILADWEAAYRGNEWRAHRGNLAPAITTVVAWLGSHLDGVLAHADIAPEFGRDVLAWHRRLARATKAGTGVHAKRTPCPRCEWMSLTWREGDEYVRCGNIDCQRLLSLDEYDEAERYFQQAQIDDAKAAATRRETKSAA